MYAFYTGPPSDCTLYSCYGGSSHYLNSCIMNACHDLMKCVLCTKPLVCLQFWKIKVLLMLHVQWIFLWGSRGWEYRSWEISLLVLGSLISWFTSLTLYSKGIKITNGCNLHTAQRLFKHCALLTQCGKLSETTFAHLYTIKYKVNEPGSAHLCLHLKKIEHFYLCFYGILYRFKKKTQEKTCYKCN